MRYRLIDTHAHLHFPAYASDDAGVLERCRARQIGVITVGTSLENSATGIEYAESRPGVWATVGLHPEHLTSDFLDQNEGEVREQTLDPERLRALALSSKKVVAIGETGLDFYRVSPEMSIDEAHSLQEMAFVQHIQIAHELDLPIVIHCRDALTRLAEVLQAEQSSGKKCRGVVHSFTGTWKEAMPLLDLGFHIAVNGIATFPLRKNQDPSTAIDRTIERIPLDRLLLETDAPYLAPAPYRGKRNEPAWVEEVAKHVARVRGSSIQEIEQVTTNNAIELFRLA